jgi:putative FmdB family regulatory protein
VPIFEYRCSGCQKAFEALVLGGQREEDVRCPDCGGRDLKKLISAPFLPSSVGKPANDDIAGSCCGSSPEERECSPGSCCARQDN